MASSQSHRCTALRYGNGFLSLGMECGRDSHPALHKHAGRGTLVTHLLQLFTMTPQGVPKNRGDTKD